MKLSAPKNVTFYVAVVLGVLGLLGALIPLGFITGLSFWLVFVGFLVLAAGNVLPNL
jgi:general stress protein CsbA